MKESSYIVHAKDPDGQARRFRVIADVPRQVFQRGVWTVTIQALRRKGGIQIDLLTWERLPAYRSR